jgi:hypothetical protein
LTKGTEAKGKKNNISDNEPEPFPTPKLWFDNIVWVTEMIFYMKEDRGMATGATR